MFKRSSPKGPSPGASFGLQLGRAGSKALFSFLEAVAPAGEDNADGENIRVVEFAHLDPDSEGRATLSGFKNFLLMRAKEQNADMAMEIVEAFDPCFRFAFERASQWKYRPNGKRGAAEKDPESIIIDQFRVLIAWTCLFAAMYDAFFILVKDRSPSAKIGVDEWTSNCVKVMKVANFVGFEMLEDLKKNKMGCAAFFFTQIDRSEDKKVELYEWLDYITRTELERKTALADCLSEEPPKPDDWDESWYIDGEEPTENEGGDNNTNDGGEKINEEEDESGSAVGAATEIERDEAEQESVQAASDREGTSDRGDTIDREGEELRSDSDEGEASRVEENMEGSDDENEMQQQQQQQQQQEAAEHENTEAQQEETEEPLPTPRDDQCPAGHPLEMFTAEGGDGFGCSECHGIYAGHGIPHLGCRACDFDICLLCLQGQRGDGCNGGSSLFPGGAAEEAAYRGSRSTTHTTHDLHACLAPDDHEDHDNGRRRAGDAAAGEGGGGGGGGAGGRRGRSSRNGRRSVRSSSSSSSSSSMELSTHELLALEGVAVDDGVERRFDLDGDLYTLAEFRDFYGDDGQWNRSQTLAQVEAELEALRADEKRDARRTANHRERVLRGASEATTPAAAAVAAGALAGTVAVVGAPAVVLVGGLAGVVGAVAAATRRRSRRARERHSAEEAALLVGEAAPVMVNGKSTGSRRASVTALPRHNYPMAVRRQSSTTRSAEWPDMQSERGGSCGRRRDSSGRGSRGSSRKRASAQRPTTSGGGSRSGAAWVHPLKIESAAES